MVEASPYQIHRTVYPLHPTDAASEMERKLIVARQLFYAIRTAREKGGDDWENRIGDDLSAEPVDVLLALIESFDDAAREVATRVTEWGEHCLPEYFTAKPRPWEAVS